MRIRDQFSDLPVSRQRKWALRQAALGNCIICGQPQDMAPFCLKHAVSKREYERTDRGYVRRLTDSKSYRLEAALQEVAR